MGKSFIMNRPVTFNTFKELLPFGILLVSMTAWGIAGEWRASSNNALTNQRLDTVIENQKEDRGETKGLTSEVYKMRDELTRLATIVDGAKEDGYLGLTESDDILAMAAPTIKSVTPSPAPSKEVVYNNVFETKEEKTAGQSAAPTQAPTPTLAATPTPKIAPTTAPLLCLFGRCLRT